MKILKAGTVPKHKTITVSCTQHGYQGHGCGSELCISEKDIYNARLPKMGMYHQPKVMKHFYCPLCGSENALPGDVALNAYGKPPPESVLEKLQSKWKLRLKKGS